MVESFTIWIIFQLQLSKASRLHRLCLSLFAGLIYISLAVTGEQIAYSIIPGHKIKPIPNMPTEALKLHKNIVHDMACVALCEDELCTGVAYSKATKECYVNQYGRILLEPEPGSVAVVKSMSTIRTATYYE